MDKILPLAKQLSRAKWLPPVVTLLTLMVLGGTVWLGALQLRNSIREQIISRDGEVLDAVAMLEQLGAESSAALSEQLGDEAGQFALALRLSRLQAGVIATRLFDPRGELVVTLPAHVREVTLSPAQLAHLSQLLPLSRYEPAARLDDFFLITKADATPTRLPLLSVLLPIHAQGQTNLLAVAELIQEGTAIQRQLGILDRHLLQQALIAFAVSGGILLLALSWAFSRLQKLNIRLQEQAGSLRRANQELALTAKTSALGAVTAHLIHGLTSPLNGLENFVVAHGAGTGEWQDVLANTKRMQALVGEVVRVLGEQANGTHYELSLAELGQVIAERSQPAAAASGVVFESVVTARGALTNRAANLVLLILENLIQNALQATARGKRVRLSITPAAEGVACTVADEGPGLPLSLQQNLFGPCRSTKPGGNGLGLALSHQLARHLGAELKLVTTSDTGSTFVLILPSALLEHTLAAEPEKALP